MNNTFGNFLRNLRKERKLSLREIERKVKISNAYLSQIERGKRGIPTLGFLKRLASVYGIDVGILTKKALETIDNNWAKGADKLFTELGGIVTVLKDEVPNPDYSFIIDGYNSLTSDGQKQLYKFLQFLLENESKS